MAKRLPEGISYRHTRSCPGSSGGRCRCTPTYQAQAWSPRDRKRLTRTFPTLAAARGWRYDALVGLRHGTMRAAGGVTLRQAAEEWLAAAEAGLVRNRSGDLYKPSALRGYEQALRARIVPALGPAKLGDIRRSDVQRLVNRMMADGLEPIGLHECRHTFASLMIAAGVNAKALSTFIGHTSITLTMDRYGHLFPGSEKEAAGLLDSYLERSVRGGSG